MEQNENPTDPNLQDQPENVDNTTPAMTINQDKLNEYLEKLKLEQNLLYGTLGGLAVALLGAVLWAFITYITKFQIGYMAVAIGFGVGYTVRFLGKGIDKIFGIIGAALALLGCLIGNLLSVVAVVSEQQGLDFFAVLGSLDLGVIGELLAATFSPIDLLFYGIAIYEGYRFSFRQITEEEIINNAAV